MVYTNINNNGQNDVLVNNTFSESYHTVRTVYNNLVGIETVKDNITEINNILANITSINNVGNSITNINVVGSNIDGVNTVKNNITNVNTVSANVNNVNNVSNNINDILTVKNSLPNINTTATNINTVNNIGNNIDNVNLISNNIDAITTVKNNLTNIDTIFDNISSVSNVGSNINNVNAVGSNIGTINLVNSNLSVIQGAADVINELNGRYINNITALRATEPAYSKQFVYLVGHTVTNVGGGLFYYDDTDITSLDDNGIIIVTNSGKRWKRVLKENNINLQFFGAIGNGSTNDTVAWQKACSKIDNNILYIPKGTYIINNTATVTNPGRILAQKGAEIKLANNTIVNTDTSYTNFVPMLRLQGVDGFIIDGLSVNGNRLNQTYPATRSSFGRGSSPRRHNASIEICSNGVNKSKNITVQNCEIYNSYLSGVMAIQVDGLRILNNNTYNNTWNAFGGGEVTNVLCQGNRSYRDGVSTQFPDTQNGGDRGAFQFREFPSTLTTSSEGISIIPNLTSLGTNTDIKIISNYIEEPCVIGAFVRACYGVTMQNNTVKNSGYQRINNVYDPASLWFEWSTGMVKDNVIIQTTDNNANGWLRPIAVVATGLRGDSTNDAKLDGIYSVEVCGNMIFCGQTYDEVVNYSSNSSKKNNFHAGIFTDKETIINNNIIEGTHEHMIMLITDANFSTEYQKNITITNNRMFNSLAPTCITLFANGTPTGTIDNITIKGNEIYDLRSEDTSGEARIVIYFPQGYSSAEITSLDISDNFVDCSNSANVNKSYQFSRIRCNANSNIYYKNNKIKKSSLIMGLVQWNNLLVENNIFENCANIFSFSFSANSKILKITHNSFINCTNRVGSFTSNGFLLDNLIMKSNFFSGTFNGFISGTSSICPKKLTYQDNVNNIIASSIDVANLVDGSGTFFTVIEKIYAKFGDFIQVGCFTDAQGVWLNGFVSGTNNITVRVENETGNTVDLTPGDFTITKREIKEKDLIGIKSYDPPSLVANTQITTTVSVLGARVGDYSLVSFSKSLSSTGTVSLFSYVSANDTVTVIFNNASGATADLSSGLLRVCVVPKDYSNGITGTSTFDPISLVDGSGQTTTISAIGAKLGDVCLASFSNDLQGVIMFSWVSANDTISVRFQNETGATVDLASGTISVIIES